MQDKATASPLDACSSAGVFTEMEDTGDGAEGGKKEERQITRRSQKDLMTE